MAGASEVGADTRVRYEIDTAPSGVKVMGAVPACCAIVVIARRRRLVAAIERFKTRGLVSVALIGDIYIPGPHLS